MRLWSIHPKYLDQKGLVACWREALLAKKVLEWKTRGYRHHPQLERFRRQKDPVAAINAYLDGLWEEACRRGYCFDKKKIGRNISKFKIPVAKGQLDYEMRHLKRKIRTRSAGKNKEMLEETMVPHPLFRKVPGEMEKWEKVK